MPKIFELVGATEVCPVMNHKGDFILVEKGSAFRVAANHHGIKRAKVHIGKRRWRIGNKIALRAE